MKSKEGLKLLIRLARFKRRVRALPALSYPEHIKEAARHQGIIIR